MAYARICLVHMVHTDQTPPRGKGRPRQCLPQDERLPPGRFQERHVSPEGLPGHQLVPDQGLA